MVAAVVHAVPSTAQVGSDGSGGRGKAVSVKKAASVVTFFGSRLTRENGITYSVH